MSISCNEYPHMMGDDDGPLAADHYKRAVLRVAPSRFSIEFLPPTKLGGSGTYSYGMRVTPVSRGDRASISSNGSNSEYDVWRRWEDCLWFQDGLELEYKRSAREKRQRLLQGKGVKKNGFYLQDQASSWESLPPGPDPSSVAQDIHQYIPKLTKRGTIFRASMATIEQRNTELQTFVEALFKEDQPALIKEMRSTRLVTDFFGYWHRDAELASKKQKAKARESRESLTPSIFSSYFSASTPSLLDSPSGKSPKSLPTSPVKRPFLRPRSSTSTERPHSVASSQITATPASTISRGRTSSESYTISSASSYTTIRRRALSVTSSDSSSSQGEASDNGTASGDTGIMEVPIIFGHNPQLQFNSISRPGSLLDALPEEHDEMTPPSGQQDFMAPLRKKTTQSPASLIQRRNRNGQVFVSPPVTPSAPALESPRAPASIQIIPERSMRESWATIDSTSTYLEGLDIGLPASPTGYRRSMASINTFMTTDSAEAVLPHTPLPSSRTPINQPEIPMYRPNPRASVPVSLSDFDIEIPEDNDINSIYDAFPRPASFIPERPETPVAQTSIPRSKAPEPYLAAPPSPTTSVSTTFSFSTVLSASTATSISTTATSSTSSSGNSNNLSIKAALNNTIIMFRVSRDITFTELRQRIYNKFIGQEGVPLSREFTIAVVVAEMNSPIAQLPEPVGTRKRSTSVTSVDHPEMRIVDSQGDWETVAYSTEGTRLTLRILDTPA
ncbi:hypothetical protein P691DRAFT_719715 [Macrolepiota fuliginosa MF-IS2]|uniref:PX domain-containing protein n=1 Tax=Macrolepiota fuliginosa MF-IS2 TaxID=1400762 RepID=A0A9P5XMJ7_9AGAR|nr:hypothetical protein P691DRAFT_719715 [Macrolepiota fuliginosa MF-IS2]